MGLKQETLQKIKQKVNNRTVWAKFPDPIVYCTKSKRLRNSCFIIVCETLQHPCYMHGWMAWLKITRTLIFASFVLLSLCCFCFFVFFYTCMLFLFTSTWGPIQPLMPETVTNFIDTVQQLA